MLDPQGYPLVAYERISDGQVMFQIFSDGTLVLASGTEITFHNGSPNGVVTAPKGSLILDFTTPSLWQNTDGAMAWSAVGGGGGGTPGGAVNDIQLNDGAGGFAGSDFLMWDSVNGLVSDGSTIAVTGACDAKDTGATDIAGATFDAAISATAPAVANSVFGIAVSTALGSGVDTTVAEVDGAFIAVGIGLHGTVSLVQGILCDLTPVDAAATITDAYGLHITGVDTVSASGIKRAIKTEGSSISEFGSAGVQISTGLINSPTVDLAILGHGASLSLGIATAALTANVGSHLTFDAAHNANLVATATINIGDLINNLLSIDSVGGSASLAALNSVSMVGGAASVAVNFSGADFTVNTPSGATITINTGSPDIKLNPGVGGRLNVTGIPVFANNAAAIGGGLVVGDFYRTGADPDTVCVVH